MVDKNNPRAAQHAQFAKLSSKSIGLEPHQHLASREYADASIIQLAAFLRDNPNPILVFNPEGAVIKTNPAAVRLLKRLQVEPLALLPAEHPQIVTACLEGQRQEYTIEVTVNNLYLALTYRSLPAFAIVYLYAIELTDYRRSEAELLKTALKTIDLTKQAVLQLQTLHKSLPQITVPTAATSHEVITRNHAPLTEMFVSMDGCLFASTGED